MYAVDVHAHTRFFHGFGPRQTAFDPLGLRLLLAVAGRRCLDAVAVTNHDYRLETDRRWRRADTAGPTVGSPAGADCTRDGDLRVLPIPGIEMSTTRGHVLAVGPDPPRALATGTVDPATAVDLAHSGGCAAILAHPFRNSTVRETDAPVDAVEVNGKQLEHRALAAELARDRDLPLVGGSDAHYPFEVGRAYTIVDAPELTPESVAAAIRDGRVEPAVAEYPLDSLLATVYDAVHGWKGHLEQ